MLRTADRLGIGDVAAVLEVGLSVELDLDFARAAVFRQRQDDGLQHFGRRRFSFFVLGVGQIDRDRSLGLLQGFDRYVRNPDRSKAASVERPCGQLLHRRCQLIGRTGNEARNRDIILGILIRNAGEVQRHRRRKAVVDSVLGFQIDTYRTRQRTVEREGAYRHLLKLLAFFPQADAAYAFHAGKRPGDGFHDAALFLLVVVVKLLGEINRCKACLFIDLHVADLGSLGQHACEAFRQKLGVRPSAHEQLQRLRLRRQLAVQLGLNRDRRQIAVFVFEIDGEAACRRLVGDRGRTVRGSRDGCIRAGKDRSCHSLRRIDVLAFGRREPAAARRDDRQGKGARESCPANPFVALFFHCRYPPLG
ncbi:hypothetical protein BN871_BS_00160 [Paenibacillus sp. P22]|nr:hypothetical protein BN871_BS_00160 [Paenibacillus sp. P22]